LEVNHDERQWLAVAHPISHCWITRRIFGGATTRPETMLGDAQWAVNPADERYRKYQARKSCCADESRNPVWWTSWLASSSERGGEITPAHDPTITMRLRHDLPQIDVMERMRT